MGKRVLCTLKKFLKITGAHHPGVWLTVNGTGLEKMKSIQTLSRKMILSSFIIYSPFMIILAG